MSERTEVSGTRVAGVIGWPIGHSRSPALHNAAFKATGIDAVYAAFAVRPGDLAAALAGARALGFLGVNVTVPHKRAALALCDEVSEVAAVTGAVNTVVVRDRRLWGTNTDVEGFDVSLGSRIVRRAVVLGAGGAAAAVVVALNRRASRGDGGGGTAISVVARDVDAARSLLNMGAFEALPWTAPALACTLAGADLLVDATSAGLDETKERALPAPIPLEALATGALVCSLVYHRRPALLTAAAGRGLETLDGGAMLVHQAAAAFTLFTGVAAPLAAMRAALAS